MRGEGREGEGEGSEGSRASLDRSAGDRDIGLDIVPRAPGLMVNADAPLGGRRGIRGAMKSNIVLAFLWRCFDQDNAPRRRC